MIRLAAVVFVLEVAMSTLSAAPAPAVAKRIDDAAAKVQPKVIAWRRDIHEHPELGNREVRTAKIASGEVGIGEIYISEGCILKIFI